MTFILDPVTLVVTLNTAVLAYVWWQLRIITEDLNELILNYNRFVDAVLRADKELQL
mgnify:CR=1 FL=1